MVTCFLKYKIDPKKVNEFKHYGQLWIDLVNKMGGLHHGYLIPHEGPNNIGYASFSFPSLTKYEDQIVRMLSNILVILSVFLVLKEVFINLYLKV